MKVIYFYSVSEEFGFFSNFAPFPIKLKGRVWPTVEHFFQAQKFKDFQYQNRIRKVNSPMIAARLGRSRKVRLRPDWEKVKDNIMRDAVRAKFTQHYSLKLELLNTGNSRIVERATNDAYWSDGGDGSGKNMLGRILMELRSNFEN